VASDGALMRTSADAHDTTWSAGAPSRLLEGRYVTGPNLNRHYDVTADSQCFLMIKEDATSAGTSPQIIIVQNWFEELQRLVPTK
jgi:hypothetical protein